MEKNTVTGSVVINATLSKVWDILTNPEKIQLYTGSVTKTDWQIGSPITWSGEMHGTKYENKGKMLQNKPNNLLQYTYWSGMGGDADLPENYSEITYNLKQTDDDAVVLNYSRLNIATEIETQIFQAHIQSMLDEIKKIAEK
jgi:uncharacterized protein YndB with AHSA1/START domain